MNFNNKNILIGITGAISAYKIPELIRIFKKGNANVKVVITPNAKEFVTPLVLATLSQNQVYENQFDYSEWKPDHISLADWADIFVIAPIDANTISKIANGIADNLLTSVACAFSKKIVLAPAMNTNMYENSIIKENLNKLSKCQNFEILDTNDGFLACGYNGKGRMAEPITIAQKTCEALNIKIFLEGKKIIITAGGTRENIDSVRFIGNYSSGKMGTAIADCAYNNGADVILITTKPCEKPYKVIEVNSAQEMETEIKNHFEMANSLIMCAAVADYKVENPAAKKIKKEKNETLTLNLVKNNDILKEISKLKKNNQTVIGFCAESEDLLNNAKQKLTDKKLDFIVANDISREDIGFSSEYNEVIILNKTGEMFALERDLKQNIANKILEYCFS